MPLFFQKMLPKQVRVGDWLKITFPVFSSNILRVEEVAEDKITGFDLLRCEQVSLRIKPNGTVVSVENWEPWSYDILSSCEVSQYAHERQVELDARVVRLREELADAETRSANYRAKIPEALKDLEKAEAM